MFYRLKEYLGLDIPSLQHSEAIPVPGCCLGARRFMTLKCPASRQLGAAIVVLLIVSSAIGLVFSRFYWGYWMSPPSVEPWLSDLVSVQSVVHFKSKGMVWEMSAVSREELREAAARYKQSPTDCPWNRLPGVLSHLHIEPRAESTTHLPEVAEVLRSVMGSGLLVHGKDGYSDATSLKGYVATGRDSTERCVVVVSAMGGQASDDHYPIYDFFFDGLSGPLLYHNAYFEDVAGIEGFRWWQATVMCFLTIISFCGAWYVLKLCKAYIGPKPTPSIIEETQK